MAEVENKKEVVEEPKKDTQEDFEGDVKVSDQLPTKADLAKCAEILVQDEKGETRTFESLYKSDDAASRHLIIFVRHFFCGNCQEFLRTLCSSITPSDLSSMTPTTDITIIGCGSSSLIPMYRETTSCPFPVYADPTQKLYDNLGMVRTLNMGNKKPGYMQSGVIGGAIKSIIQGLKDPSKALKGGNMAQIGGEFLVEGGEVKWCHRMKNTRDHSELGVIRGVLGLDDRRPPMRKTWSSNIKDLKRRSSSWSRKPSAPAENGDATNGTSGTNGTNGAAAVDKATVDKATKAERRRSWFGMKKPEDIKETKAENGSANVEPLIAEPSVPAAPAKDQTNGTEKSNGTSEKSNGAVEKPLTLVPEEQPTTQTTHNGTVDANTVEKPLNLVPEGQQTAKTEESKESAPVTTPAAADATAVAAETKESSAETPVQKEVAAA